MFALAVYELIKIKIPTKLLGVLPIYFRDIIYMHTL